MISVDRVRLALASHRAVSLPTQGIRHAAVAMVLTEGKSGADVLFIERARFTGDPWSGHMAFPGGRKQATDRSLLHTAQRETLEEIGLDLTKAARVVARLPDIMPYSRMPHPLTVTAFVFTLHQPAELVLNEEVAAVVWAPFEGVLRGDGATKFRWQKDGLDLTLPALDIEGNVVWGLTYRMLELMREVMP